MLIGVSADSVKDIFLTPFSRGDDASTNMPGVFIHAHAVSQLLRGALQGARPLRVLPEWFEAAWLLLWSAIGAGLALLVRSIVRVMLVAPPARRTGQPVHPSGRQSKLPRSAAGAVPRRAFGQRGEPS